MKRPGSLTGSIHLPDVQLNFHLSFGNDHKEVAEIKGEEAKIIGNVLNQALRFSPELQEVMSNFADYLESAVGKAREGGGQDPGT